MITTLNRRLAAACLAAALGLGGLLGIGSFADVTVADAPQDEVANGSFTANDVDFGRGGRGGAGTQSATWS